MNPEKIIIRPMHIEDIPKIYAIDVMAQVVPWSEGIFKDCLEAGYDGWVIERCNIIEGYLLSYVRAGECHILNVCIKPRLQNRGYGYQLMQYALQNAKKQGADTALLEVRPSNHAAIHLYRKLGFNEIGIRKDYYALPGSGREDALVLALDMK